MQFERLIKKDEMKTMDIDELFESAVSIFSNGYDIQESFFMFKEVIERNPNYTKDDDNAWYYLGVMFSRCLNEPDKAIEHLTKAIELWPSDGFAFEERANCWLYKGEFRKAHTDLKKAKSLDCEGMYPDIDGLIQLIEDILLKQ